jgi:hypothetical protein
MQAEWQPEYLLLYSLPGFRYCDLLLAGAAQAAWRWPASAAADDAGAEAEGAAADRGMRLWTAGA